MIPRIVKRGDLYALCYRYTDHADKTHIKLEPCASLDDARLRLEEVMQQQKKGIFIPPNAITVSELMEDFIRVCGSRKWVASTYTANIGLYRNYILPVLGSCGIQNLHSKDVDIYIRIMQELARVKRSALAALNNKNIYHIFPAWTGKTTSTVLVLKKPKTDSSIRRVWISKTVAYVLQELRKNQLHQIEMAGCDYTDYNLVIAFPNGHPCEEKRINQAFAKLKAEAKLPDVVFHSLRHSSATYKLKLNHGDLKATQGDTGHAEIDMLTKVYAHILDSDRKITAQRFEEAFYQPQDLSEQKDNSPSSPDIAALIAQIQQYPELGKILSDVLAKQASTDENTENGNGNLSDSE